MKERRSGSVLRRFFHRCTVVSGAVGLTAAFFLVLPLMQAISKPADPDSLVRGLDPTHLPPPPPPPEEDPKDEEEEKEVTPELEEAPPLNLSDIELALNPGLSEGWFGAEFAVKLGTAAARGEEVDALFSMSDLDQKPRVIYQPSPVVDAKIREKAPGTVYVLFVVNQQGKVENPVVQSSTDPILVRPAVAAVKQWRFEPGKRNGEPVRFRMRVPITFPEG